MNANVQNPFGSAPTLINAGTVPQRSNSEMKEIIIDPTGDLYYIIGNKAIKQFKLKVSTKIMSLASQPLGAMLGPNFLEGQQTFSSSHPGEVVLEEDPIQAMELLCRMLHGRFDANFDTMMKPRELLDVAKLADKYDCMATVSPHLKLCLSHYTKNLPASSDVDFLAVTYLMDHATAFKEVSRVMMVKQEGPLGNVVTAEARDVLPSVVNTMFQLQQKNCRYITSTRLLHLCGDLIIGDNKGWAKGLFMELRPYITSSTSKLEDLSNILENFAKAHANPKEVYSKTSTVGAGQQRALREEVLHIRKDLLSAMAGLCLTCCKEENVSGCCTHKA